jgi:hypothetical protein
MMHKSGAERLEIGCRMAEAATTGVPCEDFFIFAIGDVTSPSGDKILQWDG